MAVDVEDEIQRCGAIGIKAAMSIVRAGERVDLDTAQDIWESFDPKLRGYVFAALAQLPSIMIDNGWVVPGVSSKEVLRRFEEDFLNHCNRNGIRNG